MQADGLEIPKFLSMSIPKTQPQNLSCMWIKLEHYPVYSIFWSTYSNFIVKENRMNYLINHLLLTLSWSNQQAKESAHIFQWIVLLRLWSVYLRMILYLERRHKFHCWANTQHYSCKSIVLRSLRPTGRGDMDGNMSVHPNQPCKYTGPTKDHTWGQKNIHKDIKFKITLYFYLPLKLSNFVLISTGIS